MKMIGNEVYIQRGETWALDFRAETDKGHPLMIFNRWKNPYIAITVTAALYEQKGDFRRTYWLDLKNRYVENEFGDLILKPVKQFIATEPLYVEPIAGGLYDDDAFDIIDILSMYGATHGGKIVADKNSDFDVTNFLFYADPNSDGNYVYKYIADYTSNGDGTYTARWENYDFRVVKQFETKDWTEQGYLYDIKILAGDTVEERIANILLEQGNSYAELPWNDEQIELYINTIKDENTRNEIRTVYESGAPLMPDYEIKTLILPPTKLYTSVNIQGGVR